MARDIYDAHQRRRAAFRAEVFAQWGTDCVWCGRPATTADHMIPRSRLRTMYPDPDDYANAVFDADLGRPACRACNLSRGDRPTPKWMRRAPRPATPPTTGGVDRRWLA